ncbi:MMPL family transporter [Streptantibioticus silvisoli]|uniref:MMPL family transporter n=1 Tax=Streptantibioticus silvisoli TaxID=2705255 RepID=A0ABT6W4E7_9ACTN|nr:MMPL family transporter [Streptantibioticus silvisoli]MDI5965245.1 MMPL family transporter [Streptantibioticus silvisoli]
MFYSIGRFVVRHKYWTIVAWVIAAVAISMTAPSLPSSSDESSFLPKSYESIQAGTLQGRAFPAAFTPSALILYSRSDGAALTKADLAATAQVDQQLAAKHISQVEKVLPGGPSKDLKYTLGLVQMNAKSVGQPSQSTAAKTLRTDIKPLASAHGLTAKIGGQAAQALDAQDASQTSTALSLAASLGLIIITLLIIFRSPLIAILPLVLLMALDYTTASGLIADATKVFGLQANNSLSALLVVVLLGVGTDYFLFLMFRYRERLRAGDDHEEAMIHAVGRVGEAIASAAGAVIIAFLALTLCSLGFFTQLGPALAILVAVTLVAGLTLFPALLATMKPRKLFWPSKAWQSEPTGTRFASFGQAVRRRPAVMAAVSGVIMVALAIGAFGFKASFDLSSGSMPKTVESMVVQNEMVKAYSAGAADPTQVLLTSTSSAPVDHAAADAFAQGLTKDAGVAGLQGPTQFSKDGRTAEVNLSLKYAASSGQAIDAMSGLRDSAHHAAPAGTKALVGGETSVFADIQTAQDHDYKVVFPVAAILIMLILGLLLRSIVAPWYLMASVGLGFAATLGATTLLFQRGSNSGGLMFLLPMIMYLFVVAIGTDYNILMIARLREEAREGREPREAAAEALRHAGPTVAAAGFILAATFATLTLSGNSLLTEMGFAVSFGILVSAFVMAMFFTPSLTALIGHAAWWPGRADQVKAAPVADVATEVRVP